MNKVEIGMAAGDVHCFLEANGAATVAELKRATGHKEATIHQAIGWLAREDKLTSEASGRTVRWSVSRC